MAETPPHGHQEGKKSSVAKKRSSAGAGSSSSVAMAETPPRAPNHIQPPRRRRPLPPGVYFSPTPDECLGLLNRSIAGDKEMRDTRGYVFRANVYGEGPDVLRQRYPPASIRGPGEHAWWFLSQTRFQQSKIAGEGTSKRADRHVETGGYWQVEGGKEKLDDDGFKNNLCFYVDPSKKGDKRDKKRDKTPWLMQEFTSANDDGAGKAGVPALYRLYLTPHATDDQLRSLFGEDGVKHGPDRTKKPERVMLREEYFDRIAAKLPPRSVRGVAVQEHAQPPTPPEVLADYHGQQEHDLDQDEEPAFYSLENQVGPSYQIQHDQYEQEEQGPLPPPASPSLLAEIAGRPPTDNITMSKISDLWYFRPETINEQPAVESSGDEQPANFNEEG